MAARAPRRGMLFLVGLTAEQTVVRWSTDQRNEIARVRLDVANVDVKRFSGRWHLSPEASIAAFLPPVASDEKSTTWAVRRGDLFEQEHAANGARGMDRLLGQDDFDAAAQLQRRVLSERGFERWPEQRFSVQLAHGGLSIHEMPLSSAASNAASFLASMCSSRCRICLRNTRELLQWLASGATGSMLTLEAQAARQRVPPAPLPTPGLANRTWSKAG